jgi:tRNA-dihydrouridine synthase A
MHDGVEGKLPITVKCRIGTDAGYRFEKMKQDDLDNDEEEYSKLRHFIETVASSGVVTDFQIHARIAVLNKNFSPVDNRKIPRLKYDVVKRLVQDYPELTFSLNGGIENLSDVVENFDAMPGLKGVMVGRAWAADPWRFSMTDKILYKDSHKLSGYDSYPKNRFEVLQEYGKHADFEESLWDPLKIRRFLIKAVTPLFAGEANSKRYRIQLDEIARIPKKLASQGKTKEGYPPISELIMNAALDHIDDEILYMSPEDSYERSLEQEKNNKLRSITNNGKEYRSQIVSEWQESRKREEQYEVGERYE